MELSITTKPEAELTILATSKNKNPDYTDYEFTAKEGEMKLLTGTPDLLLVKLPQDVTVRKYQQALDNALQRAIKEKYDTVAIIVNEECLRATACTVEAAMLATRQFDIYRQKTKDKVHHLKKIQIVTEENEEFTTAQTICEAVNMTRDLQDMPPGDMGPQDFADAAKKMAQETGLSIDVWDEKKLAQENYNTILAVGKGSARPPRLVTLEHKHPDAKKTICLVGKGITFDTGGYNIKPTGFMEEMKYDMSGAAVVFGIMQSVATLKVPVNIIGICALADNMVSANAFLPSDVIKTAHGVTVEVGNTDAEGRLVLADALHHATLKKPDAIIDFATLTGSCIIALGTSTAAALGNDEELAEELVQAGNLVGERIWPLPLFEEYEEDIKSKIADIKNLGYKREAGTISAAAFLKNFVDEYPWVHLDIAGVAWVDRPRYFTQHGATGWGVRTTVEWLRSQ